MANSVFSWPSLNGNNVWSGSNTFNSPVLFADGSSAAPSISFASDPDLGVYRSAFNTLDLVADNGVAIRKPGGNRYLYFSYDSNGSQLQFINRNNDSLLVNITADAVNTLALRNGTNAQRLNLGQGNTALAAGRLAMGRDAAAAFAPGAGYGMLRWETGTNAGTLKLVAYSGTSAVGGTVIDNIGGGN